MIDKHFLSEEDLYKSQIDIIKRAIRNSSLIAFTLSTDDDQKVSEDSDFLKFLVMFPLMIFNKREVEDHVKICGVVNAGNNFLLRVYSLRKLSKLEIYQENSPAWELGWDEVLNYSEVPAFSKDGEIASYDWSKWQKATRKIDFTNCNKACIGMLKSDNKKFIWLPEANLQFWNILGKIKVTNFHLDKNAVKVEELLDTDHVPEVGKLVLFPKNFSIIQKFLIVDIADEDKNTPVKAILIDEKDVVMIEFPYNVVS